MPQKVHLMFAGFLMMAAVFLSSGLLAVPEVMAGQAELLSKRSATLLESCLGLGLLFLFAAIAALLGRVYVLEREVEKMKAQRAP